MADIPPHYADAIILLTGAVIAAPIFKRIGLGTVLGYLAAGIVIGPILGFIGDAEEILHFAELGVVMLLFVIGLELKPTRLWAMRRDIFGLGSVQVVTCGLVLTFLSWPLLGDMSAAIIAGFGLALSSTAFALQMLEASGDRNTLHGRKAFSILLFQDLAIIPLLALVPLLSRNVEGNIGFSTFVMGIAAIGAVVLAGLYLLNPLFRIIGRTGAREVMIAAALLVVFGAAMLMQAVGLSMALGAFLAGVLLAESSYRHELEADIEPFRGILLGLFFMAIGMALELKVVVDYWYLIALCVPVALLVKCGLIYFSARLFENDQATSIRVAAVLPQHGEFGFVLFAAALQIGIIDSTISSFLTVLVILTMALTPLTVFLGEWLISSNLLGGSSGDEEMDEDFDGAGSPVLMIGFSRMGQVASQSLLASGIDLTIIDNNVDRIRNASHFGFRIYFGDGRRKEVLLAAGIEEASLVAVCTHTADTTNRIIDMIQREWPEKKVYARSYDRAHTLQLMEKDISYHVRETFESALVLGGKMLEGLGYSYEEANKVVEDVRRLDSERLQVQRSEGIYAGMDMLHTKAVKPEPLVEPKQEGTALDDRSRILVEIDDE